MDDTEDVIVMEELRACRVCLATDARLVNLLHGPLAEMFIDLTRLPVSATDGLPQHLCSMCAALLKNAAAFKNRCRSTHASLMQGKSRRQCSNKLPYILTDPVIVDNYDQEEVKQNVKYYKDNKAPLESFDVETIELPTNIEEISADTNIVKTNTIAIDETVSTNQSRKNAGVAVASTSNYDEQEYMKCYLFQCKRKTTDLNKKLFYTYVLDKYHYKNKAIQTNDYACDVEDVTVLNTVDVDKSATSSKESDKIAFFDYITEKYVKNNVELITKVVDVTSMHLTVTRINPKEYVNSDHTCQDVNLDEFAKTYNFEIVTLTKNEQIMEHEELKQCLMYQKSTLKCDECFSRFKTESMFKDHMALHDPSNGSHVCEVCTLRFSTAAMLSGHTLWHATKYRCNQCRCSFKSITSAQEHYKTHVGVASSEREHSGMNFRSCELCDVNFPSEALLKEHCKNVIHKHSLTGATEYKCEKMEDAKAAKANVEKKQKWICDICSLTWQSSAALKYHKRVHTGEKPHQCPECPKSFRLQEALQIHMNTHTGACPYKCPNCPKAFKSHSLRHRHQRVHTGAKRYECPECQKTFTQSNSMKLHVRTVHLMLPAPYKSRARSARAVVAGGGRGGSSSSKEK